MEWLKHQNLLRDIQQYKNVCYIAEMYFVGSVCIAEIAVLGWWLLEMV